MTMRDHAETSHDEAPEQPRTKVAAGAPATPLLSVHGVSKAFGERWAIYDVSFDMAPGEVVAVLGPSGVGKSTLFRCIAGLHKADAGVVRLDGADIAGLRAADRRQIAVVFQQYNLVRRLTALDNVLAGRLGHVAQWRGILRRFERADTLKALECLERVGLLDQARQRADTLSGGQQQRVAIARALAQEARLIVADEPVASLDPGSAAGVLQLLRDIARTEGVAVLCSLHQTGYARTFSDRILGMSDGQIIVDAPAADLDDAAISALYAAVRQPSSPDESLSADDGFRRDT